MADVEKSVAVQKLMVKAGTVKRVLATKDGQEMMRILRAEFCNRLDKTQEEHMIVLNAGRMDVLAYIDQLNDYGG